jgi:hypothetical protein
MESIHPDSFNEAFRQALLQNVERLRAMRQPPSALVMIGGDR